MPLSVGCPGLDAWQALFDGTLPPEQREVYERHLESCATCQGRLHQAEQGDDDLLRVARRVGDPTGKPANPALTAALERMYEMTISDLDTADEGIDLYFLGPASRPDTVGTLGHYEVEGVIGRGGMGVVLRAFDPALHRLVAIKVLAPHLAGSATARRRFTREARAAAALSHDHVVAIYGVDEAGGLPYLVMQYVAGESLQDRLDRCGPLEAAEVVRIGMQTASGLAAAHAQGLIHRDIKPANLLLENCLARVKITDFGLARTADDSGLTQQGVLPGTPDYMAPEQARGEPLGCRADLFSLGSVLYAICTGGPPFRSSTTMAVLRQVCDEEPPPVRSLNPDIPEWLETLIRRLMAKAPADRFQTAAEVAALLEGYLAHLAQPATVPAPEIPSMPDDQAKRSEGEQATKGRRSIPRLVLLGAVLLAPLILAVVASAVFLMAQSEQPEATEIYQDFRDGKPLSPSFILVGPDADSTIQRDEAGLRITLPENRQQPAWAGVGVRSARPLAGDFEVTGTFEWLSGGRPTALDVGVALNVGGRLNDNNKFAKVGRFLDPKGQNVYNAEYWIKDPHAPGNQATSITATGRIGQLRMQREGSTLSFQVLDAPGQDFREICRGEFGADDLEVVQFWVNNRGNPVGIDVRLLDFRIRTMPRGTPPAPAAEPRDGKAGASAAIGNAPPAPEPVSASTRPLLLAAGLVLAGGLAAVLLWVKGFSRRCWLPAVALPAVLGVGIALPLAWGGRRADTEGTGKLYHDFRGSRPPLPPLYLDGPDARATTSAEEGGLRITLPEDRQQPPWAPVGVVPSFRLAGNFEVTGTYELLPGDRPIRGIGAGVVLWLFTGRVNNTKFAEIAHFLRPGPGDGNVFVASYWVDVPTGPNRGHQAQPATARTGRLRLIREGSTVRFLAADGASTDFRELTRADFGADDLLVRFAVNNNGSPTPVDARLVDFKIRAAAVTPDDPPPGADPEPPGVPAQGLTGKTWLALGVVMSLTVALCLAVWHSRRAGKRLGGGPAAAQVQPDASLPISFPCPVCGKALKARPALAGKRVKCPNCAEATTVPGPRAGDSARPGQS
jgi:serine/threonine protein kinase